MALLPPRAPTKIKPLRADFDPEAFRILMFQLGSKVTWEQSAQCPCGRKVQDVASDMSYTTPLAAMYQTQESPSECVVCRGKGYILHDAQETRVLVQDMKNYGKRFQPAGEYGQGSARMTFLPENKVALGDRITVKNSVMLVREERRRAAGSTEALRFPIVGQVLDLSTGLTTFKTLWVQKANAQGVTLSTDVLVEGTDFDVTAGGLVDWSKGVINGKAPVLNAMYTVSYYANPRYVIIDLGYGIRDTWNGEHKPANAPQFTTLPIMAIARQEYLGSHASMP